MTQTIDKFKPLFNSSNSNMDILEQEAFNSFIKTQNYKLPVLINFEKYLICSKLISSNTLIDYEEFEEFENLEVTVIGRIISSGLINMAKPFYDPLKDFMQLNRTLRRTMNERTHGLNEMFVDKNYKVIEVLAIYQ